MKTKKYKLFWKNNKDHKDVSLIEWDELGQDYYAFIKEYVNKGYHQISITGEIMLGIIESIANSTNVNIDKIELMEEDSDENEQINYLVSSMRFERKIIFRIIQTLHYLEKDSSIDIKRVYFSEDGSKTFAQVNGLIGTSDYNAIVVKATKKYVEEYLN